MSARGSRNLTVNPDPASSNAALPRHIAAASDAEAPASSSARDIYGLMKTSWAQVSRDICRAYEESRTLSGVDGNDITHVADFLESRASDCLPDGISSGLGIWQVALAVREAHEHGELQSFPVLLVPQDLCDAVCDPACADDPLEAAGREWVPADSDPGKQPLQMRHAFVVHMCDLLVRPFGVVAGAVRYDLEKFRLTYVVDADTVDVERVSSFLRALAQADHGDRRSRGQPPATSQSGAKTLSTSRSSTGDRNADSSVGKAAAMRDAFCPITLGDEGLRVAHLCHPRQGKQIYNWVMRGLANECSLSGRYDLSAWEHISSWDINSTTNLVTVDPRLHMHDAWILLPRSPSDLHTPHLVFPTSCSVKSTFWNHENPLVEKRYVFINFRQKEIGPSLLKWDADIRNLLLGYGNLTGITPVFVEKKKRSREDEVEGDEEVPVDGDDMVAKRPRKAKPSDEGHIATDTAQPPPSGMQSSIRGDPSKPVPKPMSPPSLRKLQKPALMRRPTAPETYWPEKAAYPPPIAWDAMSASRFTRHFSSLAVRCFAECLGADEVRSLVAALRVPSSRTAGRAAGGLDETAPGSAGRGDVGTVFLLAVVLLASRYAAADGGGDDDDLLVSGSVELDSTRTSSS